MILDGFGGHFGSQNDTKMGSKIDQKIDGFLDRSWKGSGRQKRPPIILETSDQSPRVGVRGGVNPSPGTGGLEDWRILEQRCPLKHLSPRGLVGIKIKE